MNCPNCGTRMIQSDIERIVGEKLFFTMECSACHYAMQVQKNRQKKEIF